jgi:uncharacterized protein
MKISRGNQKPIIAKNNFDIIYFESRSTMDKLVIDNEDYLIKPGLKMTVPKNSVYSVVSDDPNSYRVYQKRYHIDSPIRRKALIKKGQKPMFLSIKQIPTLSWSSKNRSTLKPKFSTIFFLCFGLILCGIGEGLLINSNIGFNPWFVFHQGISMHIDYSIGMTTFITSILLFIFWIPLNQKPGIGTIANPFIIANIIIIIIKYFPSPDSNFDKHILGTIAILLNALGISIYLIANLGAGSRDGLIVGIQQKTKLPLVLVRSITEIMLVSIGWFLGGTVGIGTLLFAFGIGPAVSLNLFIMENFFK